MSIVGRSRRNGQRGDADVIEDYLYGRDCVMDKDEWSLFCREVLLLRAPIDQTLDGVVGMVDEMIVFIVRAVVGSEDFSTGSDSRLMELVVVLVQFLMLCGGSGILPRDYSVARFGGGDPLIACGPVDSGDGRSFALRVVRRLVSLGRCVRGMLRVAWDNALWLEPDLVGAIGLDGGRGYHLCDIWRAAVGIDTPLGVFMQNIIGPSYVVGGPFGEGHIVHEYVATSWYSGMEYMPMSSETMAGGVVPHLLHRSGRYADFGSVDRQYLIFLHNLHWGFMHKMKYMSVRGSARFPTDLLALFGIMVGRRVDCGRPLELRAGGHRSWRLGGAGLNTPSQNKKSMSRFLSPLSYLYVFGTGQQEYLAERFNVSAVAVAAVMAASVGGGAGRSW